MKFCKYLAILACTCSLSYADSSSTHKAKIAQAIQVTSMSRLSPDLACLKLNNISSLTGFAHYHNVAFDPQIAVNPKNPKNIIIVAQQDTLSNANYNAALPLSIIILYTLDGGATWNMSDAILSRCQGGTNYKAPNNFSAAYYPTISFDGEGMCYLLFNGYNIFAADQKPEINTDEGNFVVKSVDGGINWTHVTPIFRDDGSCHFLDYPFIKADCYRKHTIYAVSSDDTCFVSDKCLDPSYTGTQNIIFQKSVDAGSSWSDPAIVTSFGADDDTFCTPIPVFNQLEVLPDSKKTLLLTTILEENPPDGLSSPPYDRILAFRSKDQGATWKSYTVASAIPHVLAYDPDNIDPILPVTDFTTKDVAVNHANGYVYIVYSDPKFNPRGQAGCVIKYSKDGGKTWSKPRPINPNSLDIQTFLPTVAVAKDGTVGVLFYDFRNFKSGDPTLSTDVWISFFDKDLKHFKGEVRLTPKSFDTRQAIRGYNGVDQQNCNFDYYLSNHVGLKSKDNDFLASFVITTDHCKIASIGEFPCDSFPFSFDDCSRQNIMFVRVER